MGQEIERKFLVTTDAWRDQVAVYHDLSQGYLAVDKERVVRVRTDGQQGYLTVKGLRRGMSRLEFEYVIPLEEAREMLASLCHKPLIEKIRYTIPAGNLPWIVDEFGGANKGLIIAEVELPAEDTPIDLPAWVGKEVTDDIRYHNSYLVEHPFLTWD